MLFVKNHFVAGRQFASRDTKIPRMNVNTIWTCYITTTNITPNKLRCFRSIQTLLLHMYMYVCNYKKIINFSFRFVSFHFIFARIDQTYMNMSFYAQICLVWFRNFISTEGNWKWNWFFNLKCILLFIIYEWYSCFSSFRQLSSASYDMLLLQLLQHHAHRYYDSISQT